MTVVAYDYIEAGNAVGVSESFIQRAVSDGELEAHYLNGTTPRILPEELRRWVENAPTERRKSAA